MRRELVFWLHDVDLDYGVNVGSIFRIAEACDVSKVYLSGITPDVETKLAVKVARGRSKWVSWERVKNWGGLAEDLKMMGYEVCAVEFLCLCIEKGFR